MAQKLSITVFVDRTPKNQTFLKTACKKVSKSKRPHKDWASYAILSRSILYHGLLLLHSVVRGSKDIMCSDKEL